VRRSVRRSEHKSCRRLPIQARNALGKIFANPAARDKSKKIELLADIRKVFQGMDGDDRITTADLISKLTVEDSRWSE
jgi:hypothetical protein